MIDLNKIATPAEVIVPIVNNTFQYNRKKYNTLSYVDGWYKVELNGNFVKIIDHIYMIDMEDLKAPTIKGYTYGNQIIFQNFDVAKRKLNKDIMSELFLSSTDTFNAIEAIIWEDGKLFYKRNLYTDISIIDVKTYFDEEKSLLSMKGVTPELKTVFLFHDLQRQKLLKELEIIKKEAERIELLKTLPGRLEHILKKVGATLINFTKQAKDRIEIIWKIDNYTSEFNSIIDASTFKVIEAGYCMSGDDKKHSVSSMILTAADYADRGKIYRTRGDRW